MTVPDRQTLLSKARRVLEWDALIEALAARAASAIGGERCRSLSFAETLEEARGFLRETAEMASLEASGDSLPMTNFPDLRPVVARAAKGAPLNPVDFRDLSTVLGLVADVIRYLGRHRAEIPGLAAIAAGLDGLAPLRLAIERCVDGEGNIRESATPDLRSLTHHANALKQKIRTKLDAILASARFADLLQERYFAQRENRYVLPIKAERKGEVPGIVHDVSASGATVFIEPRELVDLNNQIKEADLAVDREVRRILQDLTGEAALHHDALMENLNILGRLDCLRAKASLARLLGASDPAVNAEGRIRLKQARHPLLVLSRLQRLGQTAGPKEDGQGEIVANDIELGDAIRVLVVSGPNAGGKTVTLKIVGLFALMVRAGLQIPCALGSEMAFFPEVYADIGDAQDLAKDLSTFSAHITDMTALLREAAPGALVLLDEPVTSTDPAEGAALAQALLIHLAGRGFTVMATTHYNPLKALAQTHPGFANASVEFNIMTLSPTYRLILGTPGGSSAIDIAGRLGMVEAILEEAVRVVDRKDRSMELLMEDLQKTRLKLDEDARRIAVLREEADGAARVQKDLTERLAGAEQETRKTVRKKLTDELLRARAEVQSIIEGLKNDKRLLKAGEAKERLASIEHTLKARLAPAGDYPPATALRAGDRVEVTTLGTVGVLLEDPFGKKRVRIRMGETEVSVPVANLAGLGAGSGEEARTGPKAEQKPRPRTLRSTEDTETPSVLDVRGKTADEALDALLACLDQAVLAEVPLVRIIHGHGTGRLKQVLRDYLNGSPYVSAYRPGEQKEGGDGVTMVNLR